jgi:uncharacterized membrane protein
MIHWTIDPIVGSPWLALGLAFLLLALPWWMGESATVTPRRLWVLRLLRALVALMLLLATLRPGISWTREGLPKGAVAVLIDSSRSMELPAGQASQSRWEVERKIWESLQEGESLLGKDTQLVPYLYDQSLRAVPKESGPSSLPNTPAGEATDVGGALAKVIQQQTDPPLVAVVWMGDGAQTASGSQDDPQRVARQLTQLSIPMLLFGIGPRDASTETRDLAIDSVPEQLDVFTSNQSSVRGVLHARGFANREFTVLLRARTPDGAYQTITQQVVSSTSTDQRIAFQLPLIAPAQGSYELEVAVAPEANEPVVENNAVTCYLNVRDGGARVLYLEGEPRAEQKFLRRALADSAELQIDFLPVLRYTAPNWPLDFANQLSSGVYDAYILGDLDASAISDASMKLLEQRVREGAGLITLGGYHAYGPGGYGNTPIAALLPVEFDSRVRQAFGSPIIEALHHAGPLPMKMVSNHPIVTLGDQVDSAELWKSLPPLQGANRWRRIRNAPGVQVLVAGPKEQPLVVVGEAEKGRVLSLAFDGSYQWWLAGKEEQHKRFWRQSLLWCMRRESAEEGLSIAMDKRRLFRDESTNLEVIWNPGESDQPIPDGTRMRLFRDGTDQGGIILNRSDANRMSGKLQSGLPPGRYQLKATTTNSQGKPLEANLPFSILSSSAETMESNPDWGLMEQMAKLNEPAGGAIYAPEQVPDALDWLAKHRKASAVPWSDNHRLGDGLADSWLLFLAIVTLWLIQWWLRMRWSLP